MNTKFNNKDFERMFKEKAISKFKEKIDERNNPDSIKVGKEASSSLTTNPIKKEVGNKMDEMMDEMFDNFFNEKDK